jgi:hypothetical protein
VDTCVNLRQSTVKGHNGLREGRMAFIILNNKIIIRLEKEDKIPKVTRKKTENNISRIYTLFKISMNSNENYHC